MRNKKVTFADIAKYTGFSKTTVSRYFNDPDSMTLENRKKVSDALSTLGYQENKVGRILANGRTEFIGIIVPNLYMQYYAEIIHQVLKSYAQYGYKFVLFEGDLIEERERQYIHELLAYNVEGIIILSHTLPSKELADYGIPIVAIEREDEFISSVNTDNLMGGMQATSLLHKCGCDRLFFFDSKPTHPTPSKQRKIGFENICNEFSIPYEITTKSMGRTYATNYAAISEIMEDIIARFPDIKKGIFCGNDTYASIAVTWLYKRFGSYPDDFAIVGFDGSPASANAIVPITTIGQQIDVIAATALQLLTEQIEARHRREPVELPIRHEVVTPVVIARETAMPTGIA